VGPLVVASGPQRHVSGVILSAALDYYAKVWGKSRAKALAAELGLEEVFVQSWYPLEALKNILAVLDAQHPGRVRLAAQHLAKVLGTGQGYDQHFPSPEQMLQETRMAWDLSFDFGAPEVEVRRDEGRISVSREDFPEPYWENFLKGGIAGMLALSKAIGSEIAVESQSEPQGGRLVFVFSPRKKALETSPPRGHTTPSSLSFSGR